MPSTSLMKKNVALVLSSGGARGIAHIGAVEELESQGFSISSVSGSSIGSLIGGMHAMGRLSTFAEWICSLKRMDVFSLMDFTLSNHGLLKAEKIFRKLEQIIPDIPIEKMTVPFAAVATDIIGGTEVVFTEGSFYKAVRASIAIPTIITSVQDIDRIYVDGGVLNPVPVNQVKRAEGDLLVVVNLYPATSVSPEVPSEQDKNRQEPVAGYLSRFLDRNSRIQRVQEKISEMLPKADKQSQGYFTLLNSTTDLMTERIVQLTLELNKPDMVINIPRSSAGTFDFHKSKQLIEAGRAAASESIQEYKNIHS